MIYVLIDETRYIVGLPMEKELDDTNLNADQKVLLKQAVDTGIYKLKVTESPATGKSSEKQSTKKEEA